MPKTGTMSGVCTKSTHKSTFALNVAVHRCIMAHGMRELLPAEIQMYGIDAVIRSTLLAVGKSCKIWAGWDMNDGRGVYAAMLRRRGQAVNPFAKPSKISKPAWTVWVTTLASKWYSTKAHTTVWTTGAYGCSRTSGRRFLWKCSQPQRRNFSKSFPCMAEDTLLKYWVRPRKDRRRTLEGAVLSWSVENIMSPFMHINQVSSGSIHVNL